MKSRRTNKKTTIRLLGFAGLVSALSVLTACSKDASARTGQQQGQAELTPRVQEVSDSSLLRVAHPERFALVQATSQSVADRLSGTCVVSPDVNRTVPVNALGGGRVVDLKATLGQQVQKGQALVTISSPDLSSALADHLKALADEALSHKQLDRSRLLYEHGSIAQKDLEATEDAEQKAQVDVRATDDRVRMLGGDPAHPAPYIELRAPISGTIIEQNVTAAAGVKSPDNAPNLFTIADLSRVWVLCDVYENELPRARVGQVARVRLNAYPDRSYAGRIGNIAQVLDPNTRTAKVRVVMDNPSGVMKPGMFAVAELESATPTIHVVVPTTAVVQLHDANWVFLKVDATTFRRLPIQTAGESQPGTQVVISGLTPGQTVVRNALAFVQSVDQQ